MPFWNSLRISATPTSSAASSTFEVVERTSSEPWYVVWWCSLFISPCLFIIVIIVITDRPSYTVVDCQRPSFSGRRCPCLERTTAPRRVCTVPIRFFCSRPKTHIINRSFSDFLHSACKVDLVVMRLLTVFITYTDQNPFELKVCNNRSWFRLNPSCVMRKRCYILAAHVFVFVCVEAHEWNDFSNVRITWCSVLCSVRQCRFSHAYLLKVTCI